MRPDLRAALTRLVATATRRATQSQIRHVAAVAPGRATGLVARVYQQVERDFGLLAPPVSLHSPAPGPLAASWVLLRETLVAHASQPRATREAVAAAVSAANTCPYCVQVHATTLAGLIPTTTARTLATRGSAQPADPQLRAVTDWARTGHIGDDIANGSVATVPVAVPAAGAAELIGVAVTFHYLNRMVNVFLDSSPIPVRLPALLRGPVDRFSAALMAWLARASPVPGEALALLPPAQLPADLSWARGRATIASAFARAAAAIDAAGDSVVPSQVRDLVCQQLQGSRATAPGLSSRGWLDPLVATLAPAQRAVARLALLTALASYQVSDAVVADLRAQGLDDAALIELTSWASLTAARVAGARLAAKLDLAGSHE